MFCPKCHADYPETWKVCPKDQAELLKSSKIGKYTIEAPLGVGGMGTVYRAVNPDTRGEVALKVMHADVADSESARQRFKREAATVAKLKTSHVVKVYDFGAEPDGTLYLVMELLDGHSLRDEILPPPEQMELARVQFVIEGVLKGLSAAHKAGIVHRDLKPENIFLANTDDGEVPRLLDFGIARVESTDGKTRSGAITRPGTVMGTAVYMAPEQLQGTLSQIGTWSDVYAIGAMLYEMLGGKTQVKSGTLAEVLTQVLRGKLPTLAELRPDLAPELCAIIQRCLAKDPKERPQNADELRTALAQVWGGAAFASVPPPRARANQPVAATQPARETVADAVDPSLATAPTPRGRAVTPVEAATTLPSGPTPVVEPAPVAATVPPDAPAPPPALATTARPAASPTPAAPTARTDASSRVVFYAIAALLVVAVALAIALH